MSEIIFHGSRSDEDMIVYVRYHGEPWIKEHCYFVKYGDDIPSVIPEYENVSYLGIIYSSLLNYLNFHLSFNGFIVLLIS